MIFENQIRIHNPASGALVFLDIIDDKKMNSFGSTLKQISKSRILQQLDLHSFTLSAICLSSDGKTLVSG